MARPHFCGTFNTRRFGGGPFAIPAVSPGANITHFFVCPGGPQSPRNTQAGTFSRLGRRDLVPRHPLNWDSGRLGRASTAAPNQSSARLSPSPLGPFGIGLSVSSRIEQLCVPGGRFSFTRLLRALGCLSSFSGARPPTRPSYESIPKPWERGLSDARPRNGPAVLPCQISPPSSST